MGDVGDGGRDHGGSLARRARRCAGDQTGT
jgi:hypothetical protein